MWTKNKSGCKAAICLPFLPSILWSLSNSGTEIRNVLGKMLPIENCFTNSNYIGTSLAPPETATRIRIHDCIEVVSRIILWQVNSIDKRSSKTVWIIPARPGFRIHKFQKLARWFTHSDTEICWLSSVDRCWMLKSSKVTKVTEIAGKISFKSHSNLIRFKALPDLQTFANWSEVLGNWARSDDGLRVWGQIWT